LKIATRNAHALVERERPRECENRLLGQPLTEIENSEVVVRSGVRRIDSSGERAKDVDLTAVRGCRWAGSCRCAHWLLYAHRAEDGVECLGIGDEQEKSMEALHWLLEEELGLHAQNRRFDARWVIAEAAERDTRLPGGQPRRRKHQSHVEELAQ